MKKNNKNVSKGLSIGNISNIATVSSAYNVAFGWSIVFTVIAIIPALLLPMHKEVVATTK